MKKGDKDNRGSALLMVIIGVLFLGLLGSVITAASVMNARLKGYYVGERTNFYTADGILEEIRAGLGEYSSQAAITAYETMMTQYLEITKENKDKQQAFSEKYLLELKEKLGMAGAKDYYSVEILKGCLKGSEEEKDCLQILPNENKLEILEEKGYAVLKNVRIVWAGPNEEKTVLKTDICMTPPKLEDVERKQFAAELMAYAIIGDSGVELKDTKVSGSVYGGAAAADSVGILLWGSNTDLGSSIMGSNVLTRGELLAKGGKNYIGGEASEPKSMDVWARNIRLENPETGLTLEGNINVADDVEMNGAKNQLVLKGSFYGFGAEQSKAEYSSAILLNGKECAVDMTGLESLLLAGNSFIKRLGGATGQPGEEKLSENQDILLGSSLSVKSDQLVYFVPEKYVEKDEKGGYRFLWEEYAAYAGLENKVKSLLHPSEPIKTYYYRKIQGSGEDAIGCYYFLNFKNTESAVNFYRFYREANEKSMEKKAAAYLAEGQAIALQNGLLYTSSGEILYRTGEKEALAWKEANVREKNRNILEERCLRKAKEYLSRQLYLAPDVYVEGQWLPETAPTLLSALLYKDKLEMAVASGETIVKSYAGVPEGKIYIAGEAGLDIKNIDTKKGLIISLGDVTLSEPFEGMVLSFGRIKGENTILKAEPDLVERLLRAEAEQYDSLEKAEEAGSILTLFKGLDLQFLWEEEQKSVDLSNYITYENWTKNKEE